MSPGQRPPPPTTPCSPVLSPLYPPPLPSFFSLKPPLRAAQQHFGSVPMPCSATALVFADIRALERQVFEAQEQRVKHQMWIHQHKTLSVAHKCVLPDPRCPASTPAPPCPKLHSAFWGFVDVGG